MCKLLTKHFYIVGTIGKSKLFNKKTFKTSTTEKSNFEV